MKKYLTKPAIAVLAIAALAGGLTPVWASTSTGTTASTSTSSDSKVVMADSDHEYTRYRLKDLVENDPATLNLLLKTQSDYLYLIVDELDLDVKMSAFIEDHADEWEKIYKDHYADIYLEVRFDEQNGFVSLNQETKNNMVYITGKVTDDVDRVVLTTPNNGKIEVYSFTDHTFTVTIPAVISATPQYVTLKAYDGDKLVDTDKLRINTGTAEEGDVIVHSTAAYHADQHVLKVLGIVAASADKVYVTYGGVKKEAALKKVWDGTEAFSVSFDVENPTSKEVTVEAYEDGTKVDSEKVDVTNLNLPDSGTTSTYSIKGTATISPRSKTVSINGSIETSAEWDASKVKLYATAPDGVKYQIQFKDKNQFAATLPFKNRSFSSKGVTIELYEGDKLVAQAVIPHGVPVNVIPAPVQPQIHPVKVKMDEENERKEQKLEHGNKKGHGKGHEKKKQ